MAGVKDFPHALAALGTVPSYEDFVKRTGGDMYRAMGLVTAAAAAGFGIHGGHKFAASRAASRAAAPPPSAPPEAPSGYTVSSTTPKGNTFYNPAAPAAPGGPGAPPPAAPTAGPVGKVLGHVTPITRLVSLLPGAGMVHPITEYLKMAAEHWGWAKGGTVLDRLPDRTAILESLRR